MKINISGDGSRGQIGGLESNHQAVFSCYTTSAPDHRGISRIFYDHPSRDVDPWHVGTTRPLKIEAIKIYSKQQQLYRPLLFTLPPTDRALRSDDEYNIGTRATREYSRIDPAFVFRRKLWRSKKKERKKKNNDLLSATLLSGWTGEWRPKDEIGEKGRGSDVSVLPNRVTSERTHVLRVSLRGRLVADMGATNGRARPWCPRVTRRKRTALPHWAPDARRTRTRLPAKKTAGERRRNVCAGKRREKRPERERRGR